MLVVGFPAGSLTTNCFVVAPSANSECVVIDPGEDAVRPLDDVLREHRLKPIAVLITHGHLDHTWSVLPVCGAHDAPAWIHPGDRPMLTDPMRGFPKEWADAMGSAGIAFGEPDDVRELADGGVVQAAGFDIAVVHAPGHTPGSVVFRIDDHVATGDLLMAGTVGRTDLPGSDPDQMVTSLAKVCAPLPDDTIVLPGHGPTTAIGRERATNPFLREFAEQ